jgi:hypothetical protein
MCGGRERLPQDLAWGEIKEKMQALGGRCAGSGVKRADGWCAIRDP